MGMLIVIDGNDGSGKSTQSKLLADALKKESRTVTTFAFPEYGGTRIGGVIGRALKGEFGDFLHTSPYLSAWAYTVGHAAARERILKALERGHVICDRYETSNLAYQTAKLPEDKQDEFIVLLETVAFEELKLPKPDLVIYLYVPVSISSQLVAKKGVRQYLGGGTGADQHESDLPYQEKVARVYQKLARERSSWRVINCVQDENLLSPEEIHAMVWKAAKDAT